MAKLSPLHVKHASEGRHADGKGLYLQVGPTGKKSWMLRVQVDGKRRDYGLGSLDLVSLAEAREKASQWRKLAKEGKDPSLETRRHRGQQITFKQAAEQFFEGRKGSWKNAKHRQQWINTLRTYAYPSLGDSAVAEIGASDIAQVLLPIWQEKPETARRVRQRITTVLDFCQAKEWRESDAPIRAVNTLLRGIKQRRAQHFAAMPYRDLPAFLSNLDDGRETAGRLALKFLILTAARSGEVRAATWGEIDLEEKLWSIPASRMKMGRAHVVPLSTYAVELLSRAVALSAGKPADLLFPSPRRKVLSDMTLGKVLRDNGGNGLTVHGFRSSFRDWAAEHGYNNDWAEAALAHTVANRVEAAYRRTDFIDQRIGLMADWASFLHN